MRSMNYRAFEDAENKRMNRCSRVSAERPLVVNCAGNIQTAAPFVTDNREGRPDYYLLYMVQGRLEMGLPHDTLCLRAREFVLIPPHTPYRYLHREGEVLDYFYVHFTGGQVEEILERYGLLLYPTVNRTREEGGIGIRFRQLFDAFSMRDRFRDFELSALMDRLLIRLARQLAGSDGGYRQLETSLKYINGSYHKELKVPELAEMENLSVSRYNDVFRKVTGLSPMEYVTQLRIAAACELLGSTSLSVKEIGLLVGYRDAHFFSRIFKKHTRVSPVAYRKS